MYTVMSFKKKGWQDDRIPLNMDPLTKSDDWKKSVVEEQRFFCMYFGDRDFDVYKKSEREFLLRNIGHALYGPPEEQPSDSKNCGTGYSSKKLQKIQKVCSAIEKNCKKPIDDNDVWLATVFVCLKVDNHSVPVPVFRIPTLNTKKQDEGFRNSFVDCNGRFYENWNNFLKTNELPKGTYCYPRNGMYTRNKDRLQLEFGETPASSVGKKVLTALDISSTAVLIGSTAIGVGAAFVAMAPAVVITGAAGAVASGVYGIGRSISSLVDRSEHKQSINITDTEARNCWLSIAGNTIGVVAGNAPRAVAKLVQQGQLLARSGEIIVTALNIGSLTVNGLGVVNNLVVIHQKAKEGELTTLEVFQFTSSLLFFTLAAVNVKTANAVIKESEQSTWNNKLFEKLRKVKELVVGSQEQPLVLRSITKVDSKDELFATLGNSTMDTASHFIQMVIMNDLASIVLRITRTMVPGGWVKEVISAAITLQHTRSITATLMEVGVKYFEGKISREQIRGVTSILTMISSEEVDLMVALDILRQLLDGLGFSQLGQIMSTAHFLANYVKQVTAEVETQYKKELTKAQGSKANSHDVQRQLLDKRQFFVTAVLNNCNTIEIITRLKYLFECYALPTLKKWVAEYKKSLKRKFEKDSVLSEHRDFSVNQSLTEQEIYSLAEQLTGLRLSERNASISKHSSGYLVSVMKPAENISDVAIYCDKINNTVMAMSLADKE